MAGPLASVPNVLKVVLTGFIDQFAKEIWANVLHYTFGGTPPTNATAGAIATGIASSWGTNMAPEAPSPTTLDQVTVTDLSSPSAAQGEWFGTTHGTRGDDGIPANAAFLIHYPVQLRFRGGHPRQYLYVLGNADFDGSEAWSVAATQEVVTHWHNFLSSIISGQAGGTNITNFCAVRYRGKFLPNGGPPHYYLTTPLVMPIDLTQMTGDQQIASMKRRIGREEGGAPEVLKSRRVGLNGPLR